VQSDNPVAAALLSSMGYNKKEKYEIHITFLRMLLKLKLSPARMELLNIFFQTYLKFTPEENKRLQVEIKNRYPNEVGMFMEWMSTWKREGWIEGKQDTSSHKNDTEKGFPKV
jgi:hypothetical protein